MSGCDLLILRLDGHVFFRGEILDAERLRDLAFPDIVIPTSHPLSCLMAGALPDLDAADRKFPESIAFSASGAHRLNMILIREPVSGELLFEDGHGQTHNPEILTIFDMISLD